jgi:hypothetical protein
MDSYLLLKSLHLVGVVTFADSGTIPEGYWRLETV